MWKNTTKLYGLKYLIIVINTRKYNQLCGKFLNPIKDLELQKKKKYIYNHSKQTTQKERNFI